MFEAHKAAIEIQPLIPTCDNTQGHNSDFTIAELKRSLSHTSSNASGPDTIPFIFVQQIPEVQLPMLLSFYNYIWSHGFP